MEVLCVKTLLQTRIVLLNFVAVERVGKEEREVRIQIKERAGQKSVELQDVAGAEVPLVIGAERSQANASTVERIDEPEAVKLTLGDPVEGNLSRGVELVVPKVQFEAQRLLVAQMARVVPGEIVAVVATRIEEGAIGMGVLVREKSVSLVELRTVADEAPECPKGTSLQADSDPVLQAFLK